MSKLPHQINVLQPQNLDELYQFASMTADSGFFSDAREAAQAMVKIAAGQELGIAPIQAMTSIHVIKGRISLSANLMAAMLRRAGYRYEVKWAGSEAIEITYIDQGGRELGSSSFSIQDAEKADITENPSWKKFPRDMLFARAMMNGARWYVPEIALGIYDLDEVQDIPEPKAHGQHGQHRKRRPKHNTTHHPENSPTTELIPEIVTSENKPPKATPRPQQNTVINIRQKTIDEHRHPELVEKLLAFAKKIKISDNELQQIIGKPGLEDLSLLQLESLSQESDTCLGMINRLHACATIQELRVAWINICNRQQEGPSICDELWQRAVAVKDIRKSELGVEAQKLSAPSS